MIHTKIYIGSNNDTGELERGILDNILNKNLSNYTIFIADGVFKDNAEKVAIVDIYGNYNTGIIPELKKQLKQDSILVINSIVDAKFYE